MLAGSRFAVPWGGDRRRVGRIEFADFALPGIPWHRSGSGAYAWLLGEVMSSLEMSARSAAHNSSPSLIIENIFLLPSGPRLT